MKQKLKLRVFLLFEFTKYLFILIAGLVPAIVFKVYASPDETYDAIYSLFIWCIFLVIDLGYGYVLTKGGSDE